MPAPAPGPARWPSLLLAGAAWVAVAAGALVLGARLVSPHWVYELWSDRDLLRAANLWSAPQTSGAELSFGSGARVPGGLQYLLMALPLALSPDPTGVYRFQVLLELGGVLVLAAEARRRWGGWAAAVAVAAWGVGRVPNEVVSWLWNPGFLPLFAALATVGALRVVADRDARGWTLWIAAMAAGAQMHLGQLLLGALVLPAMVHARVPGARVPALVGGGLALVLYLPFLLHEAITGFGALRAVLEPGQVRAIAPGSGPSGPLPGLGALARMIVDTATPMGLVADHPGLAWAGAGAAALLGLGLVGAWAAAPWVVGPERSARRLLAGTWALVVVYVAASPQITLGAGNGERYVLALWPSACLLAGWGAHAAVRALDLRRPGLGALAAWGIAALLLTRSVSLATDAWAPRRALRSWGEVVTLVGAVRAATGWSLPEVAGRLVVAGGLDPADARAWDTYRPIDYLMALDGERFAGSQAPPCGLVVPTPLGGPPAGARLDADFVRAALHQPLPEVVVLEARPLSPRHTLVLYTLAGERCRTSLVDRYVDTPEEASLAGLWGRASPGTVRELPAPSPGTRRFGVVVPDPAPPDTPGMDTPVVLGVDLAPTPEGLVVVLHGNALRGMSYNGGWLDVAMLADPVIELREPTSGDVLTVPIASGNVGYRAQLTPLRVGPRAVPSGTWTARLKAGVVKQPQALAPGVELETVPLDALLARDLEVR